MSVTARARGLLALLVLACVARPTTACAQELARLFLLLGGAHLEEEFELQPAVHITAESPRVRLRIATLPRPS